MRILLTADAVGGVWRYSAILARALSQEGHAVLLAVIGQPSEEQLRELPEEIELEVRAARLEWQTGAETDLGPTAEWLLAIERSWRPDVIHLNQMTYTGLVTFEAPAVVVVHSDVCSWFAEVRGGPAPADWLPYRQLVRSGLRAAARVVAPSRYQAELVTGNYGPLAMTVIHNGVDAIAPAEGPGCGQPTRHTAQPASGAKARAGHVVARRVREAPEASVLEAKSDAVASADTAATAAGTTKGAKAADSTLKTPGSEADDLPPDREGEQPDARHPHRLRLLTVGRAWDEAKGISILDDALLKLGTDAPEAHLIGALASPGSTPAWRPRRLIWEGELSRAETACWMADCDVYVAPSLYEPFGLAPVEAALSGCALLLSDIGSFRELWDGQAEFVERGSANALAGSIAMLCRRPRRVEQLAESARKRAANRFGAARFAEDYLSLYAGLLRGGTPRARVSLASSRSG